MVTETKMAGTVRKRFNGTVLFASHDRTFSSLVATGIIEIKNGQAKRRHEDYSEYVSELEKDLWHKQIEAKNNKIEQAISLKVVDREKYLENKAKQKQIQLLERDLEKMQTYKNELMGYFLEHYHDYHANKVEELEDIKRKIKDKEDLWLILNSEIEN